MISFVCFFKAQLPQVGRLPLNSYKYRLITSVSHGIFRPFFRGFPISNDPFRRTGRSGVHRNSTLFGFQQLHQNPTRFSSSQLWYTQHHGHSQCTLAFLEDVFWRWPGPQILDFDISGPTNWTTIKKYRQLIPVPPKLPIPFKYTQMIPSAFFFEPGISSDGFFPPRRCSTLTKVTKILWRRFYEEPTRISWKVKFHGKNWWLDEDLFIETI